MNHFAEVGLSDASEQGDIVNKKEMILAEAKRLSGKYGYLGFTLKQLAQACDMTAPALYYFYSSKAELFKDCLISELEARNVSVTRYAQSSTTLVEFVTALAADAFEKCGASQFRTGQAMEEIIHLPEDIQTELREAWDILLITPIEEMLARVLPIENPCVPRYLLATFLINLATFSAAQEERFGREVLTGMMLASAKGVEAQIYAAAGMASATA